VATYLSARQGVDFCNNPGDSDISAAINFGITGTTDGSQPAIVGGLTTDMIVISPQSYQPATQTLTDWDPTVCANGDTTSPDYITVSITPGFAVRPSIPFFSSIQSVLLSPKVKVPYGGT
jgi:hypothetical protein